MAKWNTSTKPQDTSIQSPLKRNEAQGAGAEFSFAGLIGIDSTKGLAITGNNHKLYYCCLGIFCKTQRHFTEEFHAAQAGSLHSD